MARRFFTRRSPLDAEGRTRRAVFLLLLITIVWIVYRPGLSGPYVFDDFQNITKNPSVAIDDLSWSALLSAAFSISEGVTGRPIPMVSFALNYFYAGSSFAPVGFKLTNLFIHCINAILVFGLVRQFFLLKSMNVGTRGAITHKRRADLTAMFAAAIWALHPLQLTSVLYTVQRMTSLSALFVLGGLLLFVVGRRKIAVNESAGLAYMSAGLAGGTLLGFLCKENAVLLPAFAATVELFFFGRKDLSRHARLRLRLFYLGFVALPALAAVIYLLMEPEFVLGAYAIRNFSLTERVLTELRVLFFYLSLTFVPFISNFGLYHDDFVISTSLLNPPTTLVALVAWTVIAAAAFAAVRRQSIWAFAVAWFLVGHALESTVLALEIVHEHRNYVPSIGPMTAAVSYLATLVSRHRIDSRAVAVSALSILLVFGFVTHARAQSWSSRLTLFESLVRHHPNSYRSLSGLATAMLDQRRDARAVYKMLKAAALADPHAVYPLVEMQKILHALIPLSESVGYDVSEAVAMERGKEGWAKDAVLDREFLLELDREVANETSERLRAGIPQYETVGALLNAQSCALDGVEYCLPLTDRILDWHLLTLDRLRDNTFTGMLELSVAKLLAARGEIDQSLAYIERVTETTSGHPRYQAQIALLFIGFGAVEEAERIADKLAREIDWRKAHVGDLAILRRAIEQAKMPKTDARATATGN